jgi:hypothetical protein
MKGKLSLRFGKKKNNDTNDTNNTISPTDTKPPRISLMLNSKDNVLSDILPVSLSTTSPASPIKVNSSATKNSTNTGLLDEILGELNTCKYFFF